MPRCHVHTALLVFPLTLLCLGSLGCEEELGPSVQINYVDPVEASPAEKAPILHRANQFARRVGLALDAYYARTGTYPQQLSDLAPLDINPDQLRFPEQDQVVYKLLYEGQAYSLDYFASNPLGGVVSAHYTSESIPDF